MMDTSKHEHIKSEHPREYRLHEVLFIGGPICSQKIRMESLPWVITVHVGGFDSPICGHYDLRWYTAHADCRAPIYIDREHVVNDSSVFIQRYIHDYARPARYWDEVVY